MVAGIILSPSFLYFLQSKLVLGNDSWKTYNGLCENLCSHLQCSVDPLMRVPIQFQKETRMVHWVSFTSSRSISLTFIAAFFYLSVVEKGRLMYFLVFSFEGVAQFMLVTSLRCQVFRTKLCLCSSYLVMQEKEKVAYLFINLCFILLGPQARTILMQSSLPQAQLATIW